MDSISTVPKQMINEYKKYLPVTTVLDKNRTNWCLKRLDNFIHETNMYGKGEHLNMMKSVTKFPVRYQRRLISICISISRKNSVNVE